MVEKLNGRQYQDLIDDAEERGYQRGLAERDAEVARWKALAESVLDALEKIADQGECHATDHDALACPVNIARGALRATHVFSYIRNSNWRKAGGRGALAAAAESESSDDAEQADCWCGKPAQTTDGSLQWVCHEHRETEHLKPEILALLRARDVASWNAGLEAAAQIADINSGPHVAGRIRAIKRGERSEEPGISSAREHGAGGEKLCCCGHPMHEGRSRCGAKKVNPHTFDEYACRCDGDDPDYYPDAAPAVSRPDDAAPETKEGP